MPRSIYGSGAVAHQTSAERITTEVLRRMQLVQASAGAPPVVTPPPVVAYSTIDPDAPFATPSAYDDEFFGAGLDPNWITVNAGVLASLDTTTIPGNLRIRKTTNSSTSFAMLKPIPSVDFTAFTRLRHHMDATNFWTAGFWLTDGTTAGAGKQYRVGLGYNGGYRALVVQDTNFDTFQSAPFIGTPAEFGPYIRLRRSGTTLALDTTADGVIWGPMYSWTSAFPLTHMGLGYTHDRPIATDILYYGFYRVVLGDPNAELGALTTVYK